VGALQIWGNVLFEGIKDGLSALGRAEYKRDLTSCQFRTDYHILYAFPASADAKIRAFVYHVGFFEILTDLYNNTKSILLLKIYDKQGLEAN